MCHVCPRPTAKSALTGRRAFCAAVLAAMTAPSDAANPAAPGKLIEPRLRLPSPPGDRLVVALTLDACSGRFDHRIADTLVDAGIPATIFMTGIWIRQNPAGLAFILDHPTLFRIENHGAWHLPAVLDSRQVYGIPSAGSAEAVRREVVDGASAIAGASGGTPRWYRGAAGLYSPGAIPIIQQLGFAVAGYSLNADLGASLSAGHVAARIAGAGGGDVIVGHINHPERPSGRGIAEGIRTLQCNGAGFTHLPEPPPA